MTAIVWKVSPRYDSSKLDSVSIDDRIDIYEDRIQGWLIDVGHLLNQHEHAGFGALAMAFSYFEGYSSFARGEDSDGQGRVFFEEAILSVIPDLARKLTPKQTKDALRILWKDGRNGLFHVGMVRGRIGLLDGEHIMQCVFDNQQLVIGVLINRHAIIHAIGDHHRRYVARLRDQRETDLRANFETAWNLLHG